ncbi:RNA pseudouridine synthase [Rheinheimera riviphila]|uniref:Dual-specificity RNA pseudouridine synthase RluA n=1 Tax=Rheinheimera riviphila TaxID=1834037 RepID=A0A437QT39_9GAMM|nr:pseudouridine synthase [Rheinheimera riviphila]RVU37660.1 RNA pseudouridine synthase [Rheinheimera riviphila]
MINDDFCYQPPASDLEILFQDKDLLVVNKPSGLLTNPGKGEHLADCLLSRVQTQFSTALLVHRLDLSTSGLVVFALRRKAEAALKQQFAERIVKKTYLARVWQQPNPAAAEINVPLMADLTAPPRNKVCFEQGKSALTRYQCLTDADEHALVALFPVTGRAHQLRVHLQSIGHPILGDALYAHREALAAAPRLLLHAMVLELNQPYSGERLRFIAPPDVNAFALSDCPGADYLQLLTPLS